MYFKTRNFPSDLLIKILFGTYVEIYEKSKSFLDRRPSKDRRILKDIFGQKASWRSITDINPSKTYTLGRKTY